MKNTSEYVTTKIHNIVIAEDIKVVFAAAGVNSDLIKLFQDKGYEVRYVF